eukprot:TRINITY_DN947_c0_g1_i25.p1 TRINITY_DN947_c0_g1~~TRINITY_DN947_c0_g1_i25.p1  ORF type:complete len:213 (+),score=55.49 TRINITY_DN947_c0_g1_i25:1978-2616(+)
MLKYMIPASAMRASLHDGAAIHVATAAVVPATMPYVFTTKQSPMRVDDVDSEDIPLLAAMADMAAARAQRAEPTAKRPAAATKGRRAKKVRKETVAAVDAAAAGGDQAAALPHIERFETLDEVSKNTMSQCFLLSSATEELARNIFESDTTIHFVGKYGTYLLVRYSQPQGVAARKKTFSHHAVVTTAPKASGLKKHLGAVQFITNTSAEAL